MWIGYHALQNRVVLHSVECVAFLQRLFGILDCSRSVEKQFVGVRRVFENVRIVWREYQGSLKMTPRLLWKLFLGAEISQHRMHRSIAGLEFGVARGQRIRSFQRGR